MMTVVINGTTGIDTGTGSLIAADATTPTYLDLFEDTDNGSNYVRLIAPTSIAANRTITLPDGTGTVALTSNVIGVSQTWTDVTASRSTGTTYTNSTGKPIQVSIQSTLTGSVASAAWFEVGGVVISRVGGSGNVANMPAYVYAIVPDGATYRLNTVSGVTVPAIWAELR
jgi:hypothetical protein